MYSLGRSVLSPELYEQLVREGKIPPVAAAPAAGPGSEADPFVLEPVVVEVSRAGGGKTAGLLALYLLGAALFLRKRRV